MATISTAKKKPNVGQQRSDISSMKSFVWVGTDKRGMKLKGDEQAKNENMVRVELRKRGINAQSVKEKRSNYFTDAGGTVKPRDIAIVARQLSTMMGAGVPLVQSFEIIGGGSPNPALKKLLLTVKADLEGGLSLAEALARHPVHFDELFVNLVRAGESAGVLDTILDTVASYKERMEAIKGKIKKAMYYPVAVIAVAVIVSSILLIFVVPQFEAVFANFGAELPAFTQMIVTASRWLTSYWYMVIAIVAGSVFLFMTALNRSWAFQNFIDRLLLKLPVIGQILHQSATARFARTLAITFKAGVPLVEALDTVAGATGSRVYATAVQRVKADVAVGHQLNLAMRQTNLFSSMVIQMTAIGEEAGSLDTMLSKVAEFYEAEVNNAVDALSTLLEPFIMVIIGTLVGGMVIGMYLPIFKLGATI